MLYVIVGAMGLLILLLMVGVLVATRYVKVAPNEALIISGRRHTMPDGMNVTIGLLLVARRLYGP